MMTTHHLIAAILAGAIVVIWLGIIVIQTLSRARDKAEEWKRIYENEYQRPKKP